MTAPTHLRIRVSPHNELSVLTPYGAIPYASYTATTPLSSVHTLDLDLQLAAAPSSSPDACACGRAALPASMAPLSELDLDMVRRWTPHACAAPRARRVVNLDCTMAEEGGDEFHLAPCPGAGDAEVVYVGMWEYDEFPRFVVDGDLPARVVVRVMAPGDEEEVMAEGEGENEESESEGEEEGDGEEEDGEDEWEDEDDEDDDGDTPDSQEAKIRALMARTKYLPLTAFIAQAKNTHFTLVDVESWDEDEDDVEDKIRAELAKVLVGREMDDAVRFVSLDSYRAEVGAEVFRLESQNTPLG
ncbi:unnamed protein product [Cutaneotrichosporon oleaginosum]